MQQDGQPLNAPLQQQVLDTILQKLAGNDDRP